MEYLKYRVNSNIHKAIWKSLKGNKMGRRWESLVNYTLNDLKKRLNKTMPEDNTWNDFMEGNLHIDHILPIKLFQFKTPEDKEFKQCWSLYNLRLLPAKENLSKNANITNPILLGLLLKETKPLQLALAI